jgi:hypothetical protein
MVELKARSPGGGGSVFCPVARLERPGGGEESYINPGARSLYSDGGASDGGASDVFWEACPAAHLASRDPEATLPGEGKKPPFLVNPGRRSRSPESRLSDPTRSFFPLSPLAATD